MTKLGLLGKVRYWLVFFLWLIGFSLLFSFAEPVSAAPCGFNLPDRLKPRLTDLGCWQGRYATQTNSGSAAQIGTITPNAYSVGNDRLFVRMSVASMTNLGDRRTGARIETGWAYGFNNPQTAFNNCSGTEPKFYWAYYDATGLDGGGDHRLIFRCEDIFPTGDNVYSQEYDGDTGFWCHNFGSMVCVASENAFEKTGFNRTEQVVVYGQTNDTRLAIGTLDPNTPFVMQNVSYKPMTMGAFAPFPYPPAGLSELGCGLTNVCPYRSDSVAGVGPNNWATLFWRQPIKFVTRTTDDGTVTIGGLTEALFNPEDGRTVAFNLTSNDTIYVSGVLSNVSNVIIDGGPCRFDDRPSVTIDGRAAPANTNGLVLNRAKLNSIGVALFPSRQIVNIINTNNQISKCVRASDR